MNENKLIALNTYLSNQEINGNWFALIDAAFDPKKIKKITGSRGYQLYAGSDLEEYDELSPLIIKMESNGDQDFLQALLQACEGKPMLSFICSNRSIEELKQHLEYLHFIVSDKKNWTLRFADTRTVESLFQVLDQRQTEILLNPISHWLWFNRQGAWEAQVGYGLGPLWGEAPKEILEFTDQQFAALLEKSEPDALLDQLKEHFPDLLIKYSDVESYNLACQSIHEAREMQLESKQNDVLVLAVLWFMHGDGLDLRPEYLEMKETIRHGALIQDAVATLPSSFLDEIDTKN